MTKSKPVAKGKGRSPRTRQSRESALAGRQASESRGRMKARILNLEGRISVLETFLDAVRPKSDDAGKE